jgi:hypothetical protein
MAISGLRRPIVNDRRGLGRADDNIRIKAGMDCKHEAGQQCLQSDRVRRYQCGGPAGQACHKSMLSLRAVTVSVNSAARARASAFNE